MIRLQREYLDSSLGVQTPEGIEFVLYPAGLPVRVCAYGLDMLVQWALIGSSVIIFSPLRELLGRWLMLLLSFGVNWFYHVICELFCKGQSLGKRILGLRVVRSNGSPVNPGASFLRNLLRFADTFMFFYPIALLCMTLSRGFRRVGDWAADTLVVYTANIRPLYRISGGVPEVSGVVPPRPLSYEEKQAVLMFARRYPLLGRARADEIAHDYAESLRRANSASPAAVSPVAASPEPPGDGEYLLGIALRLSGDVSPLPARDARLPAGSPARDAPEAP
jgi:uncharacterized RDD family membrane protein YckC